jgi:hypothetical protein
MAKPTFIHVRRQSHKLQVIPAVQRKLHNALVFYHRADGCVLGREQRSAAQHLNLLGHLSDLHVEVDASRLLNLEFNIRARDRAKAIFDCLDVIDTGKQRRQTIDAGFVAGGGADRVGPLVCNGVKFHG